MKCRDCVMFREEDADSPPACWRGEKEEFARGDDEACEFWEEAEALGGIGGASSSSGSRGYRPLKIAYKSLQKKE